MKNDTKPVTGQVFSSWPEFFMTLAFFVGMKSKDQHTKVGAVIVNKRNQVVSIGYCGFPRGVNDQKKSRHKRPLKYLWSSHAERNTIYNAHSAGAKVEGCILYTPWYPCPICAQAIINSGIKKVVHFHSSSYGMGDDCDQRERWAEQAEQSRQMFREAGVQTQLYKGRIYCGSIFEVCNGEVRSPSQEK